jgi:diguanylate cyclase (GGDEF)-like protein/PAS domain S-box-containing protein
VCFLALDGTLQYVNKAYATYFDSSREALEGTNFLDLVPVDARNALHDQLLRAKQLTPDGAVRVSEHRGGDIHGESRWQEWVDKALFDDLGNVTAILSVGRDVTTRHAAQELLRFYSERDPLTGLLNRRSILEALERSIGDRSVSASHHLGLVFVDVDKFKQVNDRFGHRMGDHVLVVIGEVLSKVFRDRDEIGRVGGDEFVVVCPGVRDLAELNAIAARVGLRLAELEPPVSASYGAVLLEAGESASSLLHRADMAMYAKKRPAG